MRREAVKAAIAEAVRAIDSNPKLSLADCEAMVSAMSYGRAPEYAKRSIRRYYAERIVMRSTVQPEES